MTTQLKIDGMTCGHCVATVRKALENVNGVTEVSVDLAAGIAEVQHSPDATAESLEHAIKEEGYRIKEA